MSEVDPQSALDLHQAILGHNTWGESMPELASWGYEGFISIDGDRVEPEQLPAAVRARLGVAETDADDDSEYDIELGRRLNRQFPSLTEMYNVWPEGQQWDPAYVYDDYGRDTAYICVRRASPTALRCAYYIVSAEASFEPEQPPLCDVRIETEDRMPGRQLMIDLREKGGSLVDIAKALGIDPMTGERDLDKPDITSDTDFRVRLANELGEPLSAEQIAELEADELVATEMQAAETELQPLTTSEILGLAALARTVSTSVQF